MDETNKKVAYLDYFKDVYVYANEKIIEEPELRKIYPNTIEEINDERISNQKIVDVVSVEDTPVSLIKAQSFIRKPKNTDEDNERYLRCAFINHTEKNVSLLSLEVSCLNMYDNKTLTIKNIELDCNQDLLNASKYGIRVHDDADGFLVTIKKVIFADESTWEGNQEFRIELISEEEKPFIFYTFYHSEPKEGK